MNGVKYVAMLYAELCLKTIFPTTFTFRYVEDFDYPMSEKSKSPWITVNGVNVADSQFAIDHLKKELSIDMNSKLSDRDKGVCLSNMAAEFVDVLTQRRRIQLENMLPNYKLTQRPLFRGGDECPTHAGGVLLLHRRHRGIHSPEL